VTRAAAFFDLDRTFMRGSSVYALAGRFLQRGVISREMAMRAVLRQAAFTVRGLGLEGVRIATAEGMSRLRGLTPDVVRSLVAESFETVLLPRIYQGALERAREHQQAGELVYLVTTSLAEIVEEIATALRFAGGVGSVCQVIDGRYTGEPQRILVGREKAEAVRQLAAEHRIALSRSTAYSDGASDEPLLSAVGTAVAVNPDRTLREIAAARSWPTMRFRDTLAETADPDRARLGRNLSA
jgi:HAD superfamily hydrolase (TIGR01490 family)